MATLRFLRSLLQRSGTFIWETWTLSAEGGFYPDPLHLGPMLSVLYSNEGRPEHELDGRRADAEARAEGSRERSRSSRER